MKRRRWIPALLVLNFAVIVALGGFAHQTRETLTQLSAHQEAVREEILFRLDERWSEMERMMQKAPHITSSAVAADLGVRLYARAAETRLLLEKLPDLSQDMEEEKAFLERVGQSARGMVRTGRVKEEIADLRDAWSESVPVFGASATDETMGAEEALQRAAVFTDLPAGIFSHGSEKSGAEAHIFRAGVDGGELVAAVQDDGQVVWAKNDRSVQRSNLSPQEGLSAAQDFVLRNGYESMELHRWKLDAHRVWTAFFRVQDGVARYADRIEVVIGLDNGRMMGFDAVSHLAQHRACDLPMPEVSLETAMAAVPNTLAIEGHHMALLEDETLCFAFQGVDAAGQSYLIYVDAIGGQQVEIRILTDNETGFFTK